jgi:UDP-GlcNAc:undecaprenyl-phosphate GlcNAc-1-phosphate transferase
MQLGMFSNALLLIFAVSFMGCVLATPLVTRVAIVLGAIDKPDQFRRVHKGSVPRMGGLGLVAGLLLSAVVATLGGYLRSYTDFHDVWRQGGIVIAAAITILIGAIDDTRGVSPRMKLLGQAAAVVALYFGGIQIVNVSIFGSTIDFTHPGFEFIVAGHSVHVGIFSFLVTMIWFLGCLNVWNLIDGMDGLASGVGLLVSGTLMLVAIHQHTIVSAVLAASLAGSLAGFLLYNWHPACIFLGDTGSLLIGLLIGVIGVEGSMKGTSAVSILFPILAMGLPISDTAMAIFRRWVRNLPFSAADRRHVHHLVMNLGLNPRQAAILLYCFSAFLCGTVLLGVALHNEFLAFLLGGSGSLAFLLILTSRRDELAQLRADFSARMTRKREERQSSKTTWESIQRIELCNDVESIWNIVRDTSYKLGCDGITLSCYRRGEVLFEHSDGPTRRVESPLDPSGPTASFRLKSGRDLMLAVSLHQSRESAISADITFRFLQRLALATAERLDRLFTVEPPVETEVAAETVDHAAVAGLAGLLSDSSSQAIMSIRARTTSVSSAGLVNRLKAAVVGGSNGAAGSRPSLGEK